MLLPPRNSQPESLVPFLFPEAPYHFDFDPETRQLEGDIWHDTLDAAVVPPIIQYTSLLHTLEAFENPPNPVLEPSRVIS